MSAGRKQQTLAAVSSAPPQDTIATICRVQREQGVGDTSLLNFVVSDGTSLLATRFVAPEGGAAATLYYAEGARVFLCVCCVALCCRVFGLRRGDAVLRRGCAGGVLCACCCVRVYNLCVCVLCGVPRMLGFVGMRGFHW